MTQALPQIPAFIATQKQITADTVTIMAVDYTLSQTDIDPTRHLTLCVDTLTLDSNSIDANGKFYIPGKNFTVTARQVLVNDAITIDTSGAPMPDNVPGLPQARSGDPNNLNGDNGTNDNLVAGLPGNDAGNISIFSDNITLAPTATKFALTANGSNGQPGQKGQDGGDGFQGATGVDDQRFPLELGPGITVWRIEPGTDGGSGGNAGNGGRCGDPGNGGNSGNIFLRPFLPEGPQIALTSTAGQAGVSTPGKAGQPGPGGPGGHILDEYGNDIGMRATGASGNAAVAGETGMPAFGGRPGMVSDGAAPALIIDDVMFACLQLNMQYANLLYLNNAKSDAVSYYQWISDKTNGGQPAPDISAGECTALYNHCQGLLHQIASGLDFYGNALNYVPLVNLKAYTTTVQSILDTGNALELVYNQYKTYLQNQSLAFDQQQQVIDSVSRVINSYIATQTDLETKINTVLVPVINQLSNALGAQQLIMMNADTAFKTAVENQAKGCSFGEIFGIIKGVVTVGTDLFKLYEEPTPAGLISSISDITDLSVNLKNIMDNPIPCDDTDIGQKWQALDDTDNNKLIIEQQDFDKAIAPYLDMPEAAAYQQAVHDYIGMAQAHNAKIVDYTNSCIQYANIANTVKQKQAELARIQSYPADQNLPGLIPYINFFYSTYQDYLAHCLRYFYQENQAYNYWSCSNNAFSVDDYSFAGLGKQHAALMENIVNVQNAIAVPSQRVQKTLTITAASRPDQFARFATANAITFQVTPQTAQPGASAPIFNGWASVLLTDFTITLNGAVAGSGGIYLALYHHGNATLVSADGTPCYFTHNQVEAVYQYGGGLPPSGGSFGGDTVGDNLNLVALSPYATFTIYAPPAFNAGLQLNAVTSIDLTLTGYAYPDKIAPPERRS